MVSWQINDNEKSKCKHLCVFGFLWYLNSQAYILMQYLSSSALPSGYFLPAKHSSVPMKRLWSVSWALHGPCHSTTAVLLFSVAGHPRNGDGEGFVSLGPIPVAFSQVSSQLHVHTAQASYLLWNSSTDITYGRWNKDNTGKIFKYLPIVILS